MKSIKILIAGVLVIFAANLLTGCSDKSENVSPIGAKRIEEARQMIKTVGLTAQAEETADEIRVRLSLTNPEKKPITSVQAWLAYNPDVLEGVSVDVQGSPFNLEAPYRNGFDQPAGLVMLGRSASEAIDDEEIAVADIRFKRVGKGAAMIEAYDFRADLTGHTSANMMADGTPVNVLLEPETPLVILNQ